MITGTATAHRGAITVEVFPGGALSAVFLAERAMTFGAETLAASILDVIAEATARANERAKHALHRDVGDLGDLGLASDPGMIERVEATTPETWSL
jgi:hypothetical protein